MTNLHETQLESVAGGARRERTVRVVVEIPDIFNEDIVISAYVDGEYESSLSTTVDRNVRIKYMDICAREGKKLLRVVFNNTIVNDYEINFDDGSYRKMV